MRFGFKGLIHNIGASKAYVQQSKKTEMIISADRRKDLCFLIPRTDG
jgi:hypothetical protein